MSVRGGDLRTPPHSIEAEQAVLGGLLLDAQAWDHVADALRGDDFYRKDHRLIFESIGLLAAQGQPCDAVTVSESLERHGQLAEVGGLAYLAGLARDTPTAANVRAYAQIVRERSLLRQLLHAGSEIAASVFNNEGESARELVEVAESKVFAIAEQGVRGSRDGAVSIQTLMPALIDQIDAWHNNPSALRGLPSGFDEFDRKTGGLRPGDLVVVAGRPSMGKTTFAVNMAEYAALKQDVRAPVVIFSMEMPAEQLMSRMLSSIGRVSLGHIRSGQISDDDWPRITGAAGQLSEAKIFIDETPALTPTELRARARRVHREHGLGLVVVDYLQLMQVPGNKENRATEIAEISRGLKALAKELKVPVIALSQLNRGVEQRVDKKPVMSDLRECVTGDTLVCLTDGSRVAIRDLVGQQPEVWALDAAHRWVAARAALVWSVGSKPVQTLHLASGRRLRATTSHRVLTDAGWKTLGELVPGDGIAVARRLPEPSQGCADDARESAHALRLLVEQIDRERALPAVVFGWSNAKLADLLRSLWSARSGGRGFVAVTGDGAAPGFDTDSRRLADDLAALLLRLGIVARICTLRRAEPEPMYSLQIDDSDDCQRLREIVAESRVSADTRGAQCDLGADIFWDKIDRLDPVGDESEEVFDLTVPGPANWSADGLVSHNSGAIEQDADMILLIYREEVYDKNTTKKGIAEIDLAKHRNGEIGTFLLTFQGQYSRFANYAPDSYAEGVLRG